MRVFRTVVLGLFVLAGSLAVDAAEVPENYELVYEQDFAGADALDDFVFASADDFSRVQVGDRWALAYGHESQQSDYEPPHRSPLYIGLIDGLQVESLVLEYDVQQRSMTGDHRDHCVFFNFVGPANYYYTHIAQAADPHAHQIMLVDDAPRRAITEEGTDGYDWGPLDRWHHVRVERDADSGRIAVYVDDMDEPVMTTIDKTHTRGFVGFGSFDDRGRVTNIRLWAAETHEAEASFFEGE